MQILLCLLFLPRRRRRQIIEATAAIILEVLIRKVLELRRLDVEVLERLGAAVDDLVQRLLLHLVGAQNLPPHDFVQVVQNRLKHPLGQVDVAALLKDLFVHDLCDFSHAVIRGTVEFECLAGGGVVVTDSFEGFANINSLTIALVTCDRPKRGSKTYVDRPEALLHVVHGQKVVHAGQAVEQVIFKPEAGCWADNGGLRE